MKATFEQYAKGSLGWACFQNYKDLNDAVVLIHPILDYRVKKHYSKFYLFFISMEL